MCLLRLATYNIWNENKGRGNRFPQIVHEIESINADIIGLQEVTPSTYEALTQTLTYPYYYYAEYRDEEEGLAFFSRYPIHDSFFLNTSEDYGNSAALHALFQVDSFTVSITNLHLPWDSILEKERQIVAIDRFIKTQREHAQFYMMLGDFNCTPNSSVHNYLLGEQSLLGCESKPYWFDLGSTYAAIHGIPNPPTLDCQRNPRWQYKNTTDMPVVYDRILIMCSYGRDYDEDILHVDIFGTDISAETGLSASDHYGVVADVKLNE